jgi:hypothetical protein
MVSPPDDTYAIVVVGAMNPAIHHYAWYLHEGILSREEADAASKGGAVLCTAQISQFTFGSLTVTCEPIRWTAAVTDPQYLMRAVEIADRTFTVLPHTPVSALGLNFMHHRTTRLPKVSKILGRLVHDLPLGLLSEPNEDCAGKLNFQHVSGPGRVASVQIEPSVRADDQIYVALNFEYKFMPEGEFKSFELEIRDRFKSDREHSERQLQSILNAVNRMEEN